MNWPIALLHVVGGEDVHDAGQSEQKVILEAEHGRGSDNGSLREDVSHNLLGPALNRREGVRHQRFLSAQ